MICSIIIIILLLFSEVPLAISTMSNYLSSWATTLAELSNSWAMEFDSYVGWAHLQAEISWVILGLGKLYVLGPTSSQIKVDQTTALSPVKG